MYMSIQLFRSISTSRDKYLIKVTDKVSTLSQLYHYIYGQIQQMTYGQIQQLTYGQIQQMTNWLYFS